MLFGRDIYNLVQGGLKNAFFLPARIGKASVEVRDGVTGFVEPDGLPEFRSHDMQDNMDVYVLYTPKDCLQCSNVKCHQLVDYFYSCEPYWCGKCKEE